MVTMNKDGIVFSTPATSEDILNLAKAIVTAREVRLPGGRIISDQIITGMICAMDEATESYRKSIKEADGNHGKA